MVVGLVGALMALAIPGIHYVRRGVLAKKARADLEYLATAVQQLVWDTGQYPYNQDITLRNRGLEVWDLTSPSAGLIEDNGAYPDWQGPYVDRILLDPWGMPYFFDADYKVGRVNKRVVGSFGPNREGRNKYDKDDIYIILD